MPKRKRSPDTRGAFVHRSDKVTKTIYLTADQLATINAAAAKLGQPATAFVLAAALKAAGETK